MWTFERFLSLKYSFAIWVMILRSSSTKIDVSARSSWSEIFERSLCSIDMLCRDLEFVLNVIAANFKSSWNWCLAFLITLLNWSCCSRESVININVLFVTCANICVIKLLMIETEFKNDDDVRCAWAAEKKNDWMCFFLS